MMVNDRTKGMACAVIAASLYGLNPLFALPLYAQGMAPDSVLFFRYLFAAFMIGTWQILKKQSLRAPKAAAIWMFFLALCMAASSLFLFISFKIMDVGLASSILFVYPVMVAVLMALFFHEKLTVTTVLSLLLACCGVWLLYSGGNAVPSALGVAYVLLSALTYAVYLIGIRVSPAKCMASILMTFYSLIFGMLLFAASIAAGGLTLPSNISGWGLELANAFFSTALSLAATAAAIRFVGPTVTAIFGAFEPLTAVLIGIFVFGEAFTLSNTAGIFLVILAVTLIAAAGPVLHRLRYGRRKY